MALDLVGGASVAFHGRSLAVAYSDPQAIAWFAEGLGIDPAPARRVRDSYHPAAAMQPDVVEGLPAPLRDMLEQGRVPLGAPVEQPTPSMDLLPGAAP